MVKTTTMSEKIVNVLFFSGKFCLLTTDEDKTNLLKVNNSYYIKNVKKTILQNMFEVTKSSLIEETKHPAKQMDR